MSRDFFALTNTMTRDDYRWWQDALEADDRSPREKAFIALTPDDQRGPKMTVILPFFAIMSVALVLAVVVGGMILRGNNDRR